MSCNTDGIRCREAGAAAGMPDTETLQMAGRRSQHCTKCGAFLSAQGVCKRCGGAGAAGMAVAGTPAMGTGETWVSLSGPYWREEFKTTHQPITLSSGDTVETGQSFTDPEYLVQLGKKNRRTAVGATLVPAVDAIIDHQTTQVGPRAVAQVEGADGSQAFFDPASKEAWCTCGGAQCKHQLAAVLMGETTLSGDGVDAERGQLWGEMSELLEGRRHGVQSLADILRAADAAYAYLSKAGPDVVFNASALEQDVIGQRPANRPCPKCRHPLNADGACRHCGYPNKRAAQPESKRPSRQGERPKSAVRALLGDALQPPVSVTPEEMPAWLGREIPQPDPHFHMTTPATEMVQVMGAYLGARWAQMTKQRSEGGDWPPTMTGRAFGFYGPPGTGKNKTMREFAAALGLPYIEVDAGEGTDLKSLLGDVVMSEAGTEAKLGNVGLALQQGAVVVINEIVNTDPEVQSALYQAAQDGVIRIQGPEGAEAAYRVHPNSILGVTWNPGGGQQDRPAEALASRLVTLHVGRPDEAEETQMLVGALGREYGLDIADEELKKDVAFMRHLRTMAQEGNLAVEPGFRELVTFASCRHMTGNSQIAMKLLLVNADQGDLEAAQNEMELYRGRLFAN